MRRVDSRVLRRLLLAVVVRVRADAIASAHEGVFVGTDGAHVRLCGALATIGAGEERVMTVKGIYAVGAEHQLLYGPKEPICARDVQPATWIEMRAPTGSGTASTVCSRETAGLRWSSAAGSLDLLP